MPKAAVKARPFEAKSRAVLRIIEPGLFVRCAVCNEQVKFKAGQKVKPRQVIANVYKSGVWLRTEHFHAQCYLDAGEPHGPSDKREQMRS